MVTVQIERPRFGPADWVTSARLALSVLVAALVVLAASGPRHTAALVTVASVALVLDLVDGQVARRTGTASAAGARYDMEVDAFLILVLSIDVAATTAPWALAIGAARYLLLAATWRWPWLRGSVPPRYWAKVVAAIQGIVLVVVASGVLPRPVSLGLLGAALVLLVESFGHQVVQLWQRRADLPDAGLAAPATPPTRRRRILAGALTVAAYAIVWLALVLPPRATELTWSRVLQAPIELVGLLVLALLLPARVRRPVAALVGLLIGAMVVVKALDIGFYTELDRPYDLLGDTGLLSPALGVLRDSDGRLVADLAVVAAVLGVAAALVVLPMAAARIGGSVARHRRVATPITAVLSLGWAAASVTGLGVAGEPVASDATASLAVGQARQVAKDLNDPRNFARQIAHDPFAGTPAADLLPDLRGKDVLVVFVESYGRVAVQDSSIAPGVDRVLDRGTRTLARAGYSARSAFLTSPTYGGVSWLAHSTLESGTWVDSQRRYNQLLGDQRLTLASAFHKAGWRTVFDEPQVTDGWPQGQRFYGFDRIYGAHDVGYHGPSFGYGNMPDQYTWQAFSQRELAHPHKPLMAEIDLVSSHVPWTPLPHMVPWRDLGDGSIFDRQTAGQPSANDVLSSTAQAQAAYGTSVRYTLNALISFLHRTDDKNLVLVVLGDHQPNSTVSGSGASHDVPISVIARDPRVIHRISGWQWQPGLHPQPDAPVWPMNDFRNRFLTAFGSTPSSKGATP